MAYGISVIIITRPAAKTNRNAKIQTIALTCTASVARYELYHALENGDALRPLETESQGFAVAPTIFTDAKVKGHIVNGYILDFATADALQEVKRQISDAQGAGDTVETFVELH